MNTRKQYVKASMVNFEKMVEDKYKKSFSKYEIFKFNHYKIYSNNKTYIYLVCYYTDKDYKNQIAEWKYDGKTGVFFNPHL